VPPGQLVEVGQLLDLAVLPLDAGEVGRPDEAPVAGALLVGNHVGEGPVQRVGIDADHLHRLPDQQEDALAAKARLPEVVRRPQALVGPGLQQDDVQWA
jgi:hypothetical protein